MSDWRTVRLEELLTESQIKDVSDILKKHQDPLDAVHDLKVYLRKWEKLLESKNVSPDYLAYAIVWRASQPGNGS